MKARDNPDFNRVESALVNAIEALLDQGETFGSVTVSTLAKKAGIARSSFYEHFANKSELVTRLMQRVAEEISTAAGTWFSNPEHADRNDVYAAIEGIVAVYERHRAIMHAVVEMAATEASVDALFRGMMRDLVARNRNVVSRAARAGRTRPQLRLEVGDALMWMLERCCYQLHAIDDRSQRRRLIEGMGFVVWHSLFRDTERAESR